MPNNFISLSEAIALTTAYRAKRNTILAAAYQNKNVLALSETFDRAAFDELLSNPDCTGLRIYYGMDEQDFVKAVIVGVNSQNEDILPSEGFAEGDPVIIDQAQRCPPTCPPPSVLTQP